MFVLTKLIILVKIFILIGFVSASDKHQANDDDNMCNIKFNILCVKDVLMKIRDVTRNITHTLNLIEKNIFDDNQNKKTIDLFVDYEMTIIKSHLPTSKYHLQFLLVNNIDKVIKFIIIISLDLIVFFLYFRTI